MTDTTTTSRPALHPFLDDPVAFAHELFSVLAAGGDARILDPAATAGQSFKDAIQALKRLHPEEVGVGLPVTIADEAAGNWASASHEASIRFGIAAETLRRSLLGSDD